MATYCKLLAADSGKCCLKFWIGLLGAVALSLVPARLNAAEYEIVKLTDTVYAALAQSGGKAVSNAMFIVAGNQVVLAGAHFVPEGVKELTRAIAKVTALPVQVVLTHHHKGYNYVDFDLPPEAEVLISASTWQTLKGETRQFANPTVVFDNALTLNRGQTSIVLMNTGPGHSSGDVILYLPQEGILFASDLLFNDAVGYMGDAAIIEWGETLDLLEKLAPRQVVSGIGKVADGSIIGRFRKFFRDFMTEVLRNVEKGNSLQQTKKEFSLEQHKDLPGYGTFLATNLDRAYRQLKLRRNQ